MTSKIVRADGTTQLTGIKSVTYYESVNDTEGLVPGCVASAYIEVEVFGAYSSAPANGELLTYYQVDANNNQTLIGKFYATPSVPSKSTYSFIAYDAVSKLDVDYSARLNAIQANFPMTVYALVSDACSVAGVTLNSSSWNLSTQQVQAFYADGLTCRNILQYAAEIAGKFVRCNSNGQLIFDWYTTNSSKTIHPGATQSSYIAYKQNGLTYDNFTVVTVDGVAVEPTDVEHAAYTYPADISSCNNVFKIENNLLLNNASVATYTAVAQNLYNVMHALPSYRHAVINLFVNENPFRAGQFVSVTDAQGVTFNTPIFYMTVKASGARLASNGAKTYEERTTVKQNKTLANLSANLVEIGKLKVGWAEIDEAVIDSLEANGIDADEITVSGTLHSTDYARTSSPYADSGIGIELDTKIIAAENFAVDSDGNLYAKGGEIAGFQIHEEVTDWTEYVDPDFYDVNGARKANGCAVQYGTDGNHITALTTANEDGTIQVMSSVSGTQFSIDYDSNQVWLRVVNAAGNSTDGWKTPHVVVEYYSTSPVQLLYSETWTSVYYIESGSDMWLVYPVKKSLGANALFFKIRVADGDTVRLRTIYGVYPCLTAGSGTTLKESEDTIYLGHDGISVGTDICLTPDGHVEAGTITANKSVIDDLQLHTYTSLASIGMSNVDLIEDIYATLPNNSMLVAPADEFFATDVPTQYGVVEMVKLGNKWRGYIYFHGKTASDGTWRMYLDSNNDPTGTWVRIDKTIPIVDSGSESFTLSANSLTTRSVLFNETFTSAPSVMLTLLTDTGAVSGGTMVGCALQSSPTTTGFVIKAFNSDSQQRSPVVRWLAIGN